MRNGIEPVRTVGELRRSYAPTMRCDVNLALGAGVERQREPDHRLRGDRGAMSLWVRPWTLPNDGLTHVYMGIAPINANPGSFVVLVKTVAFLTNLVGFFSDDGAGAVGGCVIAANPVFTQNAWHHLGCRWSPAFSEFYLDGALSPLVLPHGVGDSNLPAAAMIRLGYLAVGNTMADVKSALFWDSPIPAEELIRIYESREGA